MAPNKSKKRQIDKISGGVPPRAMTRNQRRRINPPSPNLVAEEEE